MAEDPRDEAQDWPKAEFFVRGGAYVLDAVFLAVLMIPFTRFYGRASLLLNLAYHAVGVGLWGQTLGKALAGVQVIRVDGGPVGLVRGLARAAASYLSFLFLGLGYLWAAWEPRGRTWHDLLAGTRVIYPAPLGSGRRVAFSVLGGVGAFAPLLLLWLVFNLLRRWH